MTVPATAAASGPAAPASYSVPDIVARVASTPQPDLLQDVLVGFQYLLIPVVLIAAAFTSVLCLGARRTAKGTNPGGGNALIAAFAILGAVAGLVTGNSRDPTLAGALLTGLLGVITALLSYLFSREALATYRPYIPFFIIALVLDALGGLTLGASYRKRFDMYDADEKRRLLAFEKAQVELWREEEMLKLRRAYPDIPAKTKDEKK